MEGRKLAGTVLSVSCRTLVFVLIVMLLYLCGRTMFNFGKAVFAEEAVASADNAVEVEVIIHVIILHPRLRRYLKITVS